LPRHRHRRVRAHHCLEANARRILRRIPAPPPGRVLEGPAGVAALLLEGSPGVGRGPGDVRRTGFATAAGPVVWHALWSGLLTRPPGPTEGPPALWSGLLTRPPGPTEGLLFENRRPSVGLGGTVRRPCHSSWRLCQHAPDVVPLPS